MKIFFRLLLAHLLADFTLQTDFIAKWKKNNFLGVVVHSLIFFILSLIFTFPELNKIWMSYPLKINGWICLILLFLLHMLEDEYRSYNVRHYKVNDNFLFFLWDQAIHIVFLFTFSPYENFELEPIIIILCIFILGTHFTSIIILYLEIMLYGKELAYKNFNKKNYYIFLRLITMVFFLLPGKFFLLSFLVLPLFIILKIKVKHLSFYGFKVNILSAYFYGSLILYLLRKV
ncbi:MAG: DUF3307 domain-containing protein [Endomicrobiia bacterium]